MKLFSLKIKDKVFRVLPVCAPCEMKKGLSGKAGLKEEHGMLFNFKESQDVTMNMQHMLIDIDMLFIDSSLVVKKVASMSIGDEDITVKDILYVLEINSGEGEGLKGEKVKFSRALAERLEYKIKKKEKEIPEAEQLSISISNENTNIIVSVTSVPKKMEQMFKKGGTFKIYEEQVKIESDKMQVLDASGRVLMNIKGGERIFSISHTEKLVDMAKKVDLGEASEKELGELMKTIIDTQDSQEVEYTDY